jgi:hypothetical protein
LIFRIGIHRFEFRAAGRVYFPVGKAGNVFRGALGKVLDAYEPKTTQRPSGLADPPRPFVLRAADLDGRRFEPADTFALDVHLFDLRPRLPELIEGAFASLADTGLGPGRGRVELLLPVSSSVVEVDLAPAPEPARRIEVRFVTPTELKAEPSFGVLFGRVRDRISTLRALYDEGPLDVDFKALSERAARVRTVNSDLQYQAVSRRSSRTGAEHGIGGFTGAAVYEGDLAEFLPWLRAAWWTGAGKYTVWGNGAFEVAVIE